MNSNINKLTGLISKVGVNKQRSPLQIMHDEIFNVIESLDGPWEIKLFLSGTQYTKDRFNKDYWSDTLTIEKKQVNRTINKNSLPDYRIFVNVKDAQDDSKNFPPFAASVHLLELRMLLTDYLTPNKTVIRFNHAETSVNDLFRYMKTTFNDVLRLKEDVKIIPAFDRQREQYVKNKRVTDSLQRIIDSYFSRIPPRPIVPVQQHRTTFRPLRPKGGIQKVTGRHPDVMNINQS